MSTTASTRRIHNPVQRDTLTFLETAAESGGARTLAEIELEPGGGNTPHRHLSYEERFEVVEGSLDVLIDGAVQHLRPGDRATAGPGSVHRFTNPTDKRVVFRVELAPGHVGLERALQAVYGLATDGRCRSDRVPRNLLELAVLADWSDMRATGMLRLLEPPLPLLTAIARRRGVDRALAQRYCAW